MKTFFKALLGCFAALLAFVIVFFVGFNIILNDNLSKREIKQLVEKHSEIILDDIKENNFDDTLNIDGVTNVKSHDVTDVMCGGKGFASATSYYGFYYNESDKPVVMFNGYISDVDESEFIPDGDGYSYNEMHFDNLPSDNKYYTERITDGFYYYEWHF